MKEYITKEQAISVCMAIIEDITGFDYETTVRRCYDAIEPADVVERKEEKFDG